MKKLIDILLLPIYVIAWIVRFLAEAPFWLLGLVLVYVMARLDFYKYRESMFYVEKDNERKYRTILVWRGSWLTWIWGNEEDGIDGKYFRGEGFMPKEPLLKRIYEWSALRNATSNFRFIPILNLVIHPRKLRAYGNCEQPSQEYKRMREAGEHSTKALWTFTAQGLYSGFWYIKPTSETTHHRFGIGWKIYPADKKKTEDDFTYSSRWPRCGFGFQFTWNRKDSDAFHKLDD